MQFNIDNKKAVKLTTKVETGSMFGTDYLFEEADFNESEKDYIICESVYNNIHYKIIGFTKSFISCVPYNVKENRVVIYESSIAQSYEKKYIKVFRFKIGSKKFIKYN